MRKKCPYCAEENQEEAMICRHCWRDVWPAPYRILSEPRHLISSLEYALSWLKANHPALYRAILARIVESQSKPIVVRLPRQHRQATE